MVHCILSQNKLKEFAETVDNVKLVTKFDPEVITHLVSRR